MAQYKYQINYFECGTRSIQNALSTLGVEIDRDEIRPLAGTNRVWGTSKRGIVSAIRKLGFKATIYQTRNKENAWRWLKRNAVAYPIIALVDVGCHWSTFSGVVADRVILVDPSQYQTKKAPDGTGTFCYSKAEALDRWENDGSYYAVLVSKM